MDALDPTLTPAAAPAIAAAPPMLDASLPRADWKLFAALQHQGITGAGLERLLLLRATRRRRDPATDGMERDPRALFARWLVDQGRLHEGA